MGQRAIGARSLGLRALAASAALVVGVSGLTACRTNVGIAATIDGHRVSETDVSNYVTASAKPVQTSSSSSATTAPKPFVIEVLIDQRLYPALLRASKVGAPGTGQMTTLRRQYLNGKSVKTVVEGLGVKGFSASFESVIVDIEVYANLLNQAQSAGTDISGVAQKLTFPVHVNPRYGTWDATNLELKSGTSSGVPGYLTLQSS